MSYSTGAQTAHDETRCYYCRHYFFCSIRDAVITAVAQAEAILTIALTKKS